jgi:hypothetical protein
MQRIELQRGLLRDEMHLQELCRVHLGNAVLPLQYHRREFQRHVYIVLRQLRHAWSRCCGHVFFLRFRSSARRLRCDRRQLPGGADRRRLPMYLNRRRLPGHGAGLRPCG